MKPARPPASVVHRLPLAGARRAVAWLSLGVLALLAACTRTSEPANPAAASAPAPAAATQASLIWADASLKPMLMRVLADFQRRHAQPVTVHYGDSGQLRQALNSTAGSAVQLYVGLAVPPSDSDVLVVHPGDVLPQTLGVGEAWGRTQWLWRDQLCTLSRLPVVPATAMGQWQRKGVVLAGDLQGHAPTEPLARVLVQAEGLQPGLRESLQGKLRQWRAQNPGQDSAVAAVQANQAHMAIAPCAQSRALGELPAGLQLAAMTPALNVSLDYGMAVRHNASATARQLADHLQSEATATTSRQLGMTAAPQP